MRVHFSISWLKNRWSLQTLLVWSLWSLKPFFVLLWTSKRLKYIRGRFKICISILQFYILQIISDHLHVKFLMVLVLILTLFIFQGLFHELIREYLALSSLPFHNFLRQSRAVASSLLLVSILSLRLRLVLRKRSYWQLDRVVEINSVRVVDWSSILVQFIEISCKF